MNEQKSRITVIVPRQIRQVILDGLRSKGIEQLTVAAGRSPILQERKGLGLLLGESSLTSTPVEMISFFVPTEKEQQALRYVIQLGKLQIPGRGSVYAERMNIVEAHSDCISTGNIDFGSGDTSVQLFESMVSISCVVQRGQADEIAKIMLSRGIVPTITFGVGTGIRDKLGLLRITIPKEKEVLQVVVGKYDSDYVLDTMIIAGHLDLPGRGFISQSEVSCGLINAKSMVGSSGYAASIEQIITAIDKVEGGMDWRQDSSQAAISSKRTYLTGVDVFLFTNEGKSLEIAKKVMEVGVSGATISQTTLIQPESNGKLSPAREVCKMMIPAQIAEKVIRACKEANAFADESQGIYFTTEVPKAFTYLGGKK